MKGILADNDVPGQVEVLVQIWESPAWRDIWDALHLSLPTFETFSLPRESSDALLWKTCQDH